MYCINSSDVDSQLGLGQADFSVIQEFTNIFGSQW